MIMEANQKTETTIQPILIDVIAASKALSISDRTLWSMTKAGEIPCVRIRHRVLYDPEDLRRWINQKKNIEQNADK